MVTLEKYDDALIAIYAAGSGEGAIGTAFAALRELFQAAVVGVSVYDIDGKRITHNIVEPAALMSDVILQQLRGLYDDPGAKLMTGMRLRVPRRFTDIVPESRLRHASWFRLQARLAGAGYGIAMDLDIADIRVRLFVLRATGSTDFETEQVELLGRLGRHFGRAFRDQVQRLAPHATVNQAVFAANDDRFAGPSLERRLCAKFGLTLAEARVAAVVTGGHTRGGAAAALGISLNTLKTHLRRIYTKLGVSHSSEMLLAVLQAKAETDFA